MRLFKQLFGRMGGTATRRIPTTRVLVCALHPKFREQADADAQAYGAHFPKVVCRSASSLEEFANHLSEAFTVVHLFADVDNAGAVASLGISGTDLIRRCYEADVKLLWIASGNDPAGYIAGFNPEGRPISLIMTINRLGPKFDRALRRLLDRLSAGESLPLAWVNIAPQAASAPEHADLPETIYFAGGGQLRLK